MAVVHSEANGQASHLTGSLSSHQGMKGNPLPFLLSLQLLLSHCSETKAAHRCS